MRKPVKVCLTLAIMIVMVSAAEARVWYVAGGGSGDGSSWASPLGTVSAGLTASASGDAIWVKSATYEEAITMKAGVAIYGGFPASGSPEWEARDWAVNEAVIDATGLSRSAVIGADNALLDGFTVTGGRALYPYGGGVYCFSSSPAFSNCTITGNSASSGGGVCCYDSSPNLSNCTITANSAEDAGGGVYCYENSSPTLSNCTITRNSAPSGGGVYCFYNCSPTLSNCTITANWPSDGGAVYCWSSSPTVTNCILWNRGQEIVSVESTNPTVGHCAVQGGWPGEGNLDCGPEFVDPENGDYRLQNGSPCIDAGTDVGLPYEGSGPDIGAWEAPGGYSGSPCAHTPGVLHVDGDAAPGGDGSTWVSAYRRIGDALANATTGDEVWVRAGRYGKAVWLEPGVALYGGFVGTETSQMARDWAANETVIDATGLRRSAVIGADNAVLDGFTVTGGQASYGGGVYCYDSSPKLINCTITGNSASYDGGGVSCGGLSSPALSNCTITRNSVEWSGGGVFSGGLSSPTLSNCTITGNSASYDGGGVYCDDSSPTLTNCTIAGNSTPRAGGVSCWRSSPTLTNCILWNVGTELSGSGWTCTWSCIEDGAAGEGNISSDPRLVYPWDGVWADLHLLPDSPCIDAGNPHPAYNDGCLPPGLGTARNDIGAYGGPENCGWISEIPTPTGTPTVTPTPTPTWVPGDTNGDGIIAGEDLFFFCRYWREQENSANRWCDPINDGQIDEKDLLWLIRYWK